MYITKVHAYSYVWKYVALKPWANTGGGGGGGGGGDAPLAVFQRFDL